MKPIRPLTAVLALGVALTLAGCIGNHHQFVTRSKAGSRLDAAPDPGGDRIEVLDTAPADRTYRQVGVVRAPASLAEKDALAALRRRARDLRGTALLGIHRAGPSAATGSEVDRHWEATVIVWTDRPQAGTSAPAGTAPPSP